MQSRPLLVSLSCSVIVSLGACDDPRPPRGETDAAVLVDPPDAWTAPVDDAYLGPPDAFDPGAGETGRMIGMTEAHNRFRAMADTDTPIPPLVWDTELAAVAQAYSEELARSGCGLTHSSNGYGENLYWQRGLSPTAADVVAGWHAEIACYDFGTFMGTDSCDMACTSAMNASGCGHYTQVVWRMTRRLGCGVATCSSGAEIWTCNYDPPGNYLGRPPY